MEEWRDCKSFEGRYEVSNLGRVRGLRSNYNGKAKTVVKPHILKFGNNKGYCRVILLDNAGKRHSKSVHRLVATAFIGDCTGLEINHKDGNKKNNVVDNLEICNKSYNTIHAYRLGLMKPCNNGLWKTVEIYKNGEKIGLFNSIREMCRVYGLDRKSVMETIKGKYKNHHGFTFKLV